MPTYDIALTVPDANTAGEIASAFLARYGASYTATGAELVREVVRDFIIDVTNSYLAAQAEQAALAGVTPVVITVS